MSAAAPARQPRSELQQLLDSLLGQQKTDELLAQLGGTVQYIPKGALAAFEHLSQPLQDQTIWERFDGKNFWALGQMFGRSEAEIREAVTRHKARRPSGQASAADEARPAPNTPLSKTAITARIARCRDGAPLVDIRAGGFLADLEARPAELEQLGRNLLALAVLARQHSGKHPTTVVLS